jgi:cytochrome P450
MRIRSAFGDIAYLRGPLRGYFVANPDDIKYVFDDNYWNWPHPTWFNGVFRIPADGVVTTEGETWHAFRQMLEPEFVPERVAAFAPVIVQTTEEFVERWRGPAERGETLDVRVEMDELSRQIMGRSLFGEDWPAHQAAIGPATNVFIDHIQRKMEVRGGGVPAWVPTPRTDRRFNAARTVYDEAVLGVIAERRRTGARGNDMLSGFMELRNGEGQLLGDQELRDHLTQTFIAGHVTVRNVLAWTWYLLSEHPDAAERLRAELAGVLAGRAPALDDLPRLPFTSMVMHESLRLYPPLGLQARSPIVDDEIRGHRIPAGALAFLSAYVSHRHPDFWERPEEFDPDRFSEARSAGRPEHAWLPFTLGPRECLGIHFALIEVHLVIAAIAQRYRLALIPGARVETEMYLALEPRYGLPMTAELL